jgi:hypothetical protein
MFLIAAGAFAPTASAESPSQQECEAAGGEFQRTQGTVSCVIVEEETAGNAPEESSARRVTTEETTSGQGNIDNKEEETTTCEGPPGQCT